MKESDEHEDHHQVVDRLAGVALHIQRLGRLVAPQPIGQPIVKRRALEGAPYDGAQEDGGQPADDEDGQGPEVAGDLLPQQLTQLRSQVFEHPVLLSHRLSGLGEPGRAWDERLEVLPDAKPG